VVVGEADAAAARAALESTPGVGEITETGDDRATRALSTTINSHVDAFVKAIARVDVVDLTMEEPDLEETVLGFYGTDETGTEEGR